MPVILLVEDNNVALRMVEFILARAGYNTLGVGRGDDALDLIKTHVVDLAIVDLELPDISGVELVKALLRQEAALPVMILTADSTNGTQELALAAGVKMFLNKPVSSNELLAAIEKLLGSPPDIQP
jgi:DNA-binding response OmpR family regulator